MKQSEGVSQRDSIHFSEGFPINLAYATSFMIANGPLITLTHDIINYFCNAGLRGICRMFCVLKIKSQDRRISIFGRKMTFYKYPFAFFHPLEAMDGKTRLINYRLNGFFAITIHLWKYSKNLPPLEYDPRGRKSEMLFARIEKNRRKSDG